MTIDKTRYFELLKLEKELLKKNKWLFEENREKYLELQNDRVTLSSQLYWKDRKKYSSLIKNCLDNVISAEDFMYEFLNLWENNRDDFRALEIIFKTLEINFGPNPETVEFADIVDEVFSICEMFDPESSLNEEYNHIWLKDLLEESFLKMQKYID